MLAGAGIPEWAWEGAHITRKGRNAHHLQSNSSLITMSQGWSNHTFMWGVACQKCWAKRLVWMVVSDAGWYDNVIM